MDKPQYWLTYFLSSCLWISISQKKKKNDNIFVTKRCVSYIFFMCFFADVERNKAKLEEKGKNNENRGKEKNKKNVKCANVQELNCFAYLSLHKMQTFFHVGRKNKIPN